MSDPLAGRNTPWRDEEALRELYREQGLSQDEIAEEYGVSKKTILRWLKRHGIRYPWRDKDRMVEKYVEQQMNAREIAEEWGCTRSNILEWLHKHGIEVRGRLEEAARAQRKRPPRIHTDKRGYEYFECSAFGRTDYLRVHRLVAVAEMGVDAVGDKIVHHVNGVPWDNRPENLELMSRSEHGKLHAPVEVRHGNRTPRDAYD
jgi:transposase